jgi:hypothetical protein
MNSIIANNTEAAGFADGSKKGFIVPVKGELTPYNFIDMQGFDKLPMAYFHNPNSGGQWHIPAPYQIGKPVYVREAIWQCGRDDYGFYGDSEPDWVLYRNEDGTPHISFGKEKPQPISSAWTWIRKSPATMPKSAARTWITPTSVKCVRVRELTYSDCIKFLEFDYSEGQQFKNYSPDWIYLNDSQFQFGDYTDSLKSYIITKYGQAAWDNNIFIFFYECETTKM